MATLTIVTYPDPVLKQKCTPVEQFDDALHAFLDALAETMETADGIGLAANQVAVLQRIFVMDVPLRENEHGETEYTGLLEIINPQIVAKRGEIKYEEGCLSFPGVNEDVTRAHEVDLKFVDRHGQPQHLTAKGLLAICMQHELDHLDGITFLDRLSPLKRKIALRDYLRENREQIEEQAQRNRRRTSAGAVG